MAPPQVYKIVDHKCELTSFYRQRRRVLTCRQKFKRCFGNLVQASNSNARTKLYLRSTAALQTERENHFNSKYWYIIHPFSQFRFAWQMFMVIVFSISLFILPFTMAFIYDDDHRHIQLLIVEGTLDCLCMIDVFFNFFIGYQDDLSKTIVLDLGMISRRYLRSYFLVDLISSLPLESFSVLIMYFVHGTTSPTEQYRPVFAAFGAMSSLKIIRAVTLLSTISHLAEMAHLQPSVTRCIRMGVIYVILVHWCGCFHYYIPVLVNWPNLTNNDYAEDFKSSWINVYGLGEATLWKRYRYSLVKAVLEVCMIGSDTDVAHPREELIMSITTNILGVIFNLMLFATLLQMVTSAHYSEHKYYDIMNQLQAFMFHKQLPMWIQNRLITFYEHRYEKQYTRDHSILAAMSEPLRKDLYMFTRRHLVQRVTIFEGLPSKLISNIVSALSPEICLSGDIVVREGDVGDAMYFIESGSVAVMLKDHQELCHLTDGDYFGELSLLAGDHVRTATVLALETCTLFRLDRSDFQTCVVGHELVYRRFRNTAEERRTEAQEVVNSLEVDSDDDND